MHRFAESTFIVFAEAQLATLLCLLPALVAGVIADEHQRKTLHYLLASRLSSAEIVLGKLGARLVHVGTFVALGLPVVCLLALYGGLDPEKVFYVYFGTFTTVLSVAGLSILISVLARRPRDAILAAYGLEAIWLLGPPAIEPIAPLPRRAAGLGRAGQRPADAVQPDGRAGRDDVGASATGPAGLARCLVPGLSTVRRRCSARWWRCTGVAGLLFLTLAIAGLRPLRGSSWPGAEPRTGWWTRLASRATRRSRATAPRRPLARNELLASRIRRPPCGDAPDALEGAIHHAGRRPEVAGRPAGRARSSACCWAATCSTWPIRRWRAWCAGAATPGPRQEINVALRTRRRPLALLATADDRRLVGRGHHRRARAGHLDQPGHDAADARRGRSAPSSSAPSGAPGGSGWPC